MLDISFKFAAELLIKFFFENRLSRTALVPVQRRGSVVATLCFISFRWSVVEAQMECVHVQNDGADLCLLSCFFLFD